ITLSSCTQHPTPPSHPTRRSSDLDQAREVADAVVVGVEERLHVQLVDDRVLVPERILSDRQLERGQRRVHGRPPCGAMRQIAKRSEEHTSGLQSRSELVCRLLLEK